MKRILALACLILIPSVARASNTAPAALPAAQHALQVAVDGGKVANLLQARATLAALSAAEPKNASLHYWVALADWRAVPRLTGGAAGQAERFCKDGLDHADQALAIDPKFAEARALKAGLLGMSYLFNPSSGVSLGVEIVTTMAEAVGAAPENPRVLLLDALNTLNKPAFVGGGPDRALPKFQQAIVKFEAEAAAGGTPGWGHDDALLWAGRTAMRLKSYALARDEYRRALAVNPDNAWVKFVLLPEAEKALAAPDSSRAAASPNSAKSKS